MIAVSGLLAAILTNDVALLLVVPFTMLFRKATDLDLAPLVVLEVAAANLIGCVSPLGNPQNLFLYRTRGASRPPSFFAAQGPWVAAAALLLAAAVPVLVRGAPRAARARRLRRGFRAGRSVRRSARRGSRGALRGDPPRDPGRAGARSALLLGRRVFDADFSLVAVFALFVGVAGLERGRLYAALDPVRIFGHQARGLVLSGALLSQFVSNVPAAMLLARPPPRPRGSGPAVRRQRRRMRHADFRLLFGAQVFLREGGDPRAFWRRFLPVSFALLGLLVVVSLALVSVSR
jgi:hypothetical protein